jgi:pyruvate-ferredoxin/flavodoxin oxidoreductase
MDRLAGLCGRRYSLFDYDGPADAERVIVSMGSGAEVVRETAAWLAEQGEKVGALQVLLFRPFSAEHFLAALPESVQSVAVLDRTKEPGAPMEPLHADVIGVLADAVATGRRQRMPRVIGGRYGLSSKEFTPGMAKAVFDELKKPSPRPASPSASSTTWPRPASTTTATSTSSPRTRCAASSSGSARTARSVPTRTACKIIEPRAGSVRTGLLRLRLAEVGWGDRLAPAFRQAPHLGDLSDPPGQLRRLPQVQLPEQARCPRAPRVRGPPSCSTVSTGPMRSGTGCRRGAEADHRQATALLRHRRLGRGPRLGLGPRINTILQTCFFHLSGVMPTDQAIAAIKDSIKTSYGKKGDAVVKMNFAAVDAALDALHEVQVPARSPAPSTSRPSCRRRRRSSSAG